MSNSNAVPKQLKPFVKGDPRINRKGRPRTSDQAKSLILSILHETALDENEKPLVINGHIATKAEIVFRNWLGDPDMQAKLIERAFGKVPNETKLVGADGGPVKVDVAVKGYVTISPDEWPDARNKDSAQGD